MATRFVLPVLLALSCFAGFSSSAGAASGRIQFEVDHVRRSALVVQYDRLKKGRRPVLILLHGGGSTASRLHRTLGLDEAAKAAGFILAYPGAAGREWQTVRRAQPGQDDVALVRALIEKLVGDGLADRNHIYIAGVSSGGMVALRVACEASDLVAGAGAIIAQLPRDIAAACKPSRPVSVMLINGAADPLLPWQGGKASLTDMKDEVASVEGTLAPFLAAAGCASAPRTSTQLPDRDVNDGSKAFLERAPGCKAPVELVRIEGGGHTIPGRRTTGDRGAIVGARNNDIDSGRMLLDFFRPR